MAGNFPHSNEMVTEHIKTMENNKSKSIANAEAIEKLQDKVDDLAKFHSILSSFKEQIKNIDKKLDAIADDKEEKARDREVEREEKKEMIKFIEKSVNKLAESNQESIQDKFINWLIPIVSMGILYSIINYVNSGGAL